MYYYPHSVGYFVATIIITNSHIIKTIVVPLSDEIEYGREVDMIPKLYNNSKV